MLSMLLGFAALTLDGSNLYSQRAELAAAADAAAKAAAMQYRLSGAANLQTVAQAEAARLGATAVSGTTVVVYRPPTGGAYAGNPDYIEVVVSRRLRTFFASVIGFPTMTPAARAVAGVAPSSNCLYGLDTTGTPLDLANSANLDMPGCTGVSNVGMAVSGGSSVSAQQLLLTTTCTGSGCPSSGVVPNTPLKPDPLAALPTPSPSGTCSHYTLAKNSTATIGPGCYANVTVAASAVLTLQPGTYHVTGTLDLSGNATLKGTGVLIHLAGTSSRLTVSSSTEMTLTAPTTGTYAGILFFQDRDNTNSLEFKNVSGSSGSDNSSGKALTASGVSQLNGATSNSNSSNSNSSGNGGGNGSALSLSGLLYFPAATVTVGNESSAVDCAEIVAGGLLLRKSATVRLASTCAGYSGSPVKTTSISE